MQQLKAFMLYIGELRTMLITTAVICVAFIPFTSDEIRTEGWGLFPDVLAPVVSMILVFGILLDMLMSRVFQVGGEDGAREKFAFIFKLEGLVLLALIGLWAPYFYRAFS
ncbi:hypothetical protein [Sulfuriflexus sp.]|uniref:hypothetical protein n=1 Tax=Sulfuriflexus sp. TaxID=2015443 RepID=UPI0028CC754B|nr:hypothetical protein [Sulfuriflexus sp.]MDT8405595.1 hypothetical protein [Sulfuriflexus sp.]